ncbi:hypothetical protein, partial [Sporisorium scitamineum]
QELAEARSEQSAWRVASPASQRRDAPVAQSDDRTLPPEQWNDVQKKKSISQRSSKGWPEPKALQSLERLFPLKPGIGKKGALSNRFDEGTKQDINQQAFGGKLQWMDGVYQGFNGDVTRKKLPLHMSSRRLPLESVAKWYDTRWDLYIPEHGLGPMEETRGTVYEHRPHYLVWAVPRKLKVGFNPIILYGAGYIDLKDNAAVDRHLATLLRSAELIDRAHA